MAPSGALPLNAAIRAAVLARFARLSSIAMSIIRTAAVAGTATHAIVLAAATSLDEDETIAALDEGIAGGFVAPAGEDRYVIVPELTRAVLYEDISPLRRRYLHRRLATALAAQPANLADQAESRALVAPDDPLTTADPPRVYLRYVTDKTC